MKRKILNILFSIIIIYSLFLTSIYIEALTFTTKTYGEIGSTLDIVKSKLTDFDTYLLTETPFNCTGTKLMCTGSSETGIGSISKREYEIIGITSYLTPKKDESYWLMGSDTSTTAYIATKNNGVIESSKENTSGVRATAYIKKNTTLSGSGTYDNPYTINAIEEQMPPSDVNILAIYIDWDGDGQYTKVVNGQDESKARTDVPAGYSYVLDESKTNCTNNEEVTWNTVQKSVTIKPINSQTSCQIYLKNVTDYLVNAIAQPYVREGTNLSITNQFVGKYVKMDPSVCTTGGVCGIIPDPNNNSAVSSPGSACNLYASGAMTAEGTGNCNIQNTYCKGKQYSSDDGVVSSLNNWRIIYIENLYDEVNDPSYQNKNLNANVYITTAKSPECVLTYPNWVAGEIETGAQAIVRLQNVANKYCNDSIVDGGVCDSTNVYPLNGTDFERVSKYTLGQMNMSQGTFKTLATCFNNASNLPECFYSATVDPNSVLSLINNGEYYYFATSSACSSYAYLYTNWNKYYFASWLNSYANSNISCGGYAYNKYNQIAGVRHVLKLKAGIKYTGGDGTHDNPYTIIP